MKIDELKKNDYPEYYQQYTGLLPDSELIELLESQKEAMLSLFNSSEDVDIHFSYGEGKWTIAEVLQHMVDTERIFQYRALCISRKDQTSLPGFDQDRYVAASNANERSLTGLMDEYKAVRDSTISLFKSFSPKMMQFIGLSNGQDLSTAAAGFIIAGHEKHHLKLFKGNYRL
ncbi:MAG: DinB family protein [Bacteroidota bacterium]